MTIAAELTGARHAFPQDPLEFRQRHIKFGRRRAFSLHRHEYLRDIICCDAVQRVVQKAAQVGVSDSIAIADALHWVTQGLNVGYFLPDRDRMKRFVQKKVDRIINADNAIAASMTESDDLADDDFAGKRQAAKGADNTLLKRFGATFISFSGLQNLIDAKSDDLDYVICDEVDELDPEISIWLDDRVMHSDYKYRLWLSQPGIPGTGVNELFEQSDQRVYQHRCPKCRKWHVLEDEWPANLYLRCADHRAWHPFEEECSSCARAQETDIEVKLCCLNCGTKLRETDREVRTQWVPLQPGRELAGFRLSQLYGPAMSPRELWQSYRQCLHNSQRMRNFVISKLGKPYAGDRQPVTEETIQKAAGEWLLGLRPFLARQREVPAGARAAVIGGADIGNGIIYAVLAVLFEKTVYVVDVKVFSDERRGGTVVTAWEQLRRFFAVCDYFVLDGLYDRADARKTLRTPGLTGAMAFFPTNCQQLSATMAEEVVDSDLRYVKQDRTVAIDDMADHLREGRLRLPSLRVDMVHTLQRHCGKLYKVPNPATRVLEYQKNVENHLGLALTYVDLAGQTMEIFGLGPTVPLGDESSYVIRGSHLNDHRGY